MYLEFPYSICFHLFPQPHKGVYAYDIAIIKLYVSITFSEKVRPICFPKKRTKDHNLTVWSAGWGLRSVEKKDNPDKFYNATNPESSCITNEVGPETFKAVYTSQDSKPFCVWYI